MEGLVTGRIVYYIAYGTPGGEYPAGVKRAAVVTEVEHDQSSVGLCVLNPTGLFFRQGVNYDPNGAPGTWQWMFAQQPTRYKPDRQDEAKA